MIYRELGASGISMSAIGLGTWAIGGLWWGGTDEADSIAALRRGLDLGINLIDTAPCYGFGLSEELVGKAIKGYDRDKVVVATKVGLAWNVNEGQHFFDMDGKTVFRNLKAYSIRYEVEQSLRRLGVEYIDLYQTHWQDNTTPIAETMDTLMALKEEGKIRAIGVSNATVAQMEEYLAVGPLDSNQPLFNMLDRGLEAEALPFCQAHQISILSYSSLALGLLTGKMDPAREFGAGDQRKNNKRFTPEYITKTNAMLDRFAPFREKYGLDQTQLTIAWTISRPGITCALVGVRNAAQTENIAPGAVEIAPEDLAVMDAIIAEG
jgi:aryl-alcohol dehydrogenase-like predicted oxidoreductase